MLFDESSRRITVADMAPHVHSFLPQENKVEKLVSWLRNWIMLSLECGKIRPLDMLPLKSDLAVHIGVSQGTIQNVFRRLEDEGIIESKQRIGSYIKDRTKDSSEKLTSKRELAVEIIKKYIIENGYNVGDTLISTRKLANIIGISNTTLGVAILNLVANGVLIKQKNTFVVKDVSFKVQKVQTKTLVEKVAENLKEYIQSNYKSGDKLPPNSVLMKLFNVSSKTIHDSIKLLAREGYLYTRRGQYGTIICDGINKKHIEPYCYEKILHKIRAYLVDNCQVGDKLPSIKFMAQEYETSEKTVKKALDALSEDGYLTFSRGRYGGTFVMDIPQPLGETYKWLAISSDYISN